MHRLPDFVERATALAALGSGAALYARDDSATTRELTTRAERLVDLAAPTEASVIVAGRPDVAAGVGAQGVHLRAADLTVADARRVITRGWISRAVHTVYAAEEAVAEGADYLVFGNIWETPSHPGRPGAGLALLAEIVRLGRPVIAIGGVTVARAAACRDAGAWGVGTIGAVWDADDPLVAATALAEAMVPTP